MWMENQSLLSYQHCIWIDSTQLSSQAAQLFLPLSYNSEKLLLRSWQGENSLLKFFAQNHLKFSALSGNPAVIFQKGGLLMN